MREGNLSLSPFTLGTSHGGSIRGEVRRPASEEFCPVLIICHSFMAFKDWGFFPYSAAWLAQRGFAVVTFNFSMNGVVGDANRITDFDAFAENTFTRELEDLRSVVDAVAEGRIAENLQATSGIGLLGHSRGGGIAIVHTAGDPRISTLATWSAISTFDRWTPHQKGRWRETGILPLAKDSTVSPLRLGIGLLDDLERRADALQILSWSRKLRVPWLIVHGKEDLTVQSREAEALYEASDHTRSRLEILEHVGHLYNAATEGEDHYATLQRILGLTLDWFNEHLKKE